MNLVIPNDFRHYEIETPDGTLSFDGKLLGVVDNDRKNRPRWVEIELYRYIVTEPGDDLYGQQVYLVHMMGHSVVYHLHESDCNRGIAVPVEEFSYRTEFPQELEACRDVWAGGKLISRGCNPGDWRTSPNGTMYDVEVLRHTYAKCTTADDVLRQLRKKKPCRACNARGIAHGTTCHTCHGKGFDEMLSAPGQRLVELVRYKDAEIAQAARRTVKL